LTRGQILLIEINKNPCPIGCRTIAGDVTREKRIPLYFAAHSKQALFLTINDKQSNFNDRLRS